MTIAGLTWPLHFLMNWGEKEAKSVRVFSSPKSATKLLYDLG